MKTRILKQLASLTGLLVLAFATISCATMNTGDTKDQEKIMIRFDKAYIPALAMSSKGDENATKKAMQILLDEWKVIRPELASLFQSDADSLDSLGKTDRIIKEAADTLEKGELLEVHETLELVKAPFREIRESRNIEYPLDSFEQYHMTMEAILHLTAGKTSGDMTGDTLTELNTLAAKGVELWQMLQNVEIDGTLFGFDETKLENLKKGLENGKSEGEKFKLLLDSGDIDGMLAESGKLKSYYTQVFLMFGDFDRLKK